MPTLRAQQILSRHMRTEIGDRMQENLWMDIARHLWPMIKDGQIVTLQLEKTETPEAMTHEAVRLGMFAYVTEVEKREVVMHVAPRLEDHLKAMEPTMHPLRVAGLALKEAAIRPLRRLKWRIEKLRRNR